ncbi:hypothetical protein ACFQXA_16595 [Nocardiopsis composta]
MLQVKKAEDAPLADVSPLDSGIVFCGSGAAEEARRLTSEGGFNGPVLIDPAAYERHVATPSGRSSSASRRSSTTTNWAKRSTGF